VVQKQEKEEEEGRQEGGREGEGGEKCHVAIFYTHTMGV
jgi:hypothetical protein